MTFFAEECMVIEIKSLRSGVKRWKVSVHPYGNVTKQCTVYGPKSKAVEKEEELNRYFKAKRGNNYNDIETLEDGFNYYVNFLSKQPSRKGKNIKSLRSTTNLIAQRMGKNQPIQDPDIIGKACTTMYEHLIEENKYQIARNSVRYTHAMINLLIRKHLTIYKVNPITQTFEGYNDEPGRLSLISENQFVAILNRTPRFLHPLFKMLYWVPTRPDELMSLTKDKLTKDYKNLYLADTKTHKNRFIPVPECLCEYVRNLPQKTELIFYNYPNGQYKKISGETYRKYWIKAVTDLGIPEIRTYDLRATAANNMILAGVPKELVLKMGGWANEIIFNRFYRRVQPVELNKSFQDYEKKRKEMTSSYGSMEEALYGTDNPINDNQLRNQQHLSKEIEDCYETEYTIIED